MNKLISVLILLMAPIAQAQATGNWLMSPGLFYTTDSRARNSKSDTSQMLIDLRFAYNVSPGFYLGLHYGVDNETANTSGYANSSDNYNLRNERTSWGPVGVFMADSWSFSGTFFYSSSWRTSLSNSAGTTNSTYEGQGLQFSVAYRLPIGSFFFSPEISYKMLSYTKLTTNGSSEALSPSLKENKLDPYLSLWFIF